MKKWSLSTHNDYAIILHKLVINLDNYKRRWKQLSGAISAKEICYQQIER